MLSDGLGSTNKSYTSLVFFRTRALLLLCFLFLSPSFYLAFSGTSDRNYPFSPSFLLGYNGSTVTHFFQAMTWPISWPDEVRCFSHLQSHVVTFPSPLASTHLFSQTGDVVSHQNSLTHRSPQYLLKNLRFLVSFSATDISFC